MSTSKHPHADEPEQAEPTEQPQSAHVLEFTLGENRYCVDIGYVAEIVNTEQLTAVPNTADHVEGVMDLRGETTKIVNLRTIFGERDEDEELGSRIIVFKRKRGSNERIGWLADEVYQVQEVRTDAVDTSVDGEGIAGVIRREDEFVFWIDPTSVRV
ncbi:purine-binding chemotaxis protein CheW [Natronolimnobius sp. AArcel1]|uniref:chemotaxis protein CheW n=1 Tax=Natronolimnobius sp. AArcel1 TaxID=1679093 RepID=UPI0013EAD58B|nr:chemotaxis protein CheW [Natronolimnobius sp. AArcel1]NGM70129.1 purine-binding chemotaxis protein CheW [Natronolimnobius sp. AArcel1]